MATPSSAPKELEIEANVFNGLQNTLKMALVLEFLF
jgi:hypothetical protein